MHDEDERPHTGERGRGGNFLSTCLYVAVYVQPTFMKMYCTTELLPISTQDLHKTYWFYYLIAIEMFSKKVVVIYVVI